MALMTAKEYIDSLRALNTRVYMFGRKIDNWVDDPIIRPSINCVAMNSFHQACQTFISQNVGAGRYDRVSRIVRTCLLCTVVLGVSQSALAVEFSHQLVSIYNSEPAVIAAGVQRLRMVASLYVIFGAADVLVGAIRGYGIPIVPVIINLLGTCVFRLIWIGLLDTDAVGVGWVYLSYPVSWTIIAFVLALYWLHLRRRELPAGRNGGPQPAAAEK